MHSAKVKLSLRFSIPKKSRKGLLVTTLKGVDLLFPLSPNSTWLLCLDLKDPSKTLTDMP